MRGRSRRGWVPAALCAIALGWLAAAPAEAAFGPVDPEQLAGGQRIDEARPWVSPLGEQLVFYREIEPQQVLGLRVRPSGGVFGPKQSLTGESNFEMPRDVSFDSSGEALAIWGIATRTVHAQFARRAPGALFGPTKESPCYRFAGSSVGPHGELAVVCAVEVAANKFRLEFTEGSSLSAFPGGQAPLGPAIESEFLEPKVRYGADGTLAVAWRYEAGGKRFAEVAVRPPGSKAALTEQTLMEVPSSGPGAFVEDVAVTADGTTIVLVDAAGEGLEAFVRPSGGAFTPVKIAPAPTEGQLGVDAAGNAIVVLDGSSVSGTTIQYAVRPPGGSFGAAQDVVPAGAYAGGTLSVAADGTVFAELFKSSPGGIDVAVRPPGGSFGAPLPVAGAGERSAGFALTPGDDLLVSWTVHNGAGDEVFAGGIDSGAPPALTDVSVPTAGVLGVTAAFSAHASDTMGVRGVHWSFGDGTSADGESASHAYAAAGTFTVTVSATDRAGNTSSATRTISVIDPNAKQLPLIAPLVAATGPAITLKLPRSVRFKSLLKRGVTAEVATSEPATVLGNLLGRARGGRIAAVGDLIVASKTLKNVKAKRKLVLRPTPSRLGKRRSLSLAVQVVATDARGLQRTATRKLKVKR